jgi:hypothetical protein
VAIGKQVQLTADTMNFDGGASSVTGSGTLGIVTRTADQSITIGTATSGLVLNAAAFKGYDGLLYIGALPKTGGVSAGVFGVPDKGVLGGPITVNSPIDLGGSKSVLVLVSGSTITLSGTAPDLLSAGTVVLAATTSLLDVNGTAGITSNTIVLAAGQIGSSQSSSIGVFPAGGGAAPTVQVGSGNSTSNIGGDVTVFQQVQGAQAPDAQIYDTDVGVTAVNSNITNASQQSAANQQTGGLLGSGFIDVSVFQQISLYDVNGSGIQLPGDQCEEETATGTGCGQ